MKAFAITALAVALFGSSSLATTVECYNALNPRNISIKEFDSKRTETARRAFVKLQPDAFVDAEGLVVPSSIELTAVSRKLRFETSAPASEADKTTFQVECDGGSVKAEKVGGILVLNTNGLSGETKSSDGCANSEVTFKDLALEKVACPAPVR